MASYSLSAPAVLVSTLDYSEVLSEDVHTPIAISPSTSLEAVVCSRLEVIVETYNLAATTMVASAATWSAHFDTPRPVKAYDPSSMK
ncbi:unnamed protein product, partial [Mesorhabditis spiculigera]